MVVVTDTTHGQNEAVYYIIAQRVIHSDTESDG